jgi:hypothetical protein
MIRIIQLRRGDFSFPLIPGSSLAWNFHQAAPGSPQALGLFST